MRCTNCNYEIPDGSVFCPVCGAKQELKVESKVAPVIESKIEPVIEPKIEKRVEPKKIVKKKSYFPGFVIAMILFTLSLITIVALVLFPNISPLYKDTASGNKGGKEGRETSSGASERTSTGSSSGHVEGFGADSPEQAAIDYLKFLSEGNISGMLSCCAVESFIENVDAESVIERNQALIPTSQQLFVWDGQYSKEVCIEKRRGNLSVNIYRQMFSLANKDASFGGMVVSLSDYASIQSMIDEFFPSNVDGLLKTIEIDGVVTVEEVFGDNAEKYSENINRQCETMRKIYGAEDYVPVAIKFECNGKPFYFGADMVKYNSGWYICDFIGQYGYIRGADMNTGGIAAEEKLS